MKTLISLIGFALLIYLALYLFMYLMQRRLLGRCLLWRRNAQRR